MKKMRILHVGNHTIPCIGGIETVIWDIARKMATAGHDVTILVFNTCTNGATTLPAKEIVEGVVIRRVPMRGFSFYRIPPVRELLNLARKHDIIHVHGLGGSADVLSILKNWHRKPIVINTHGGFFHTKNRGFLKKIYANFILPLSWKNFDYIIFDSQQDRQHFAFLPSKGRSSIIPDGVNTAQFKLIPIRKKMVNHFIFVGRLSVNKRVDRLIEAFSAALAKKNIYLHIIGSDWEGIRPSLEALVKKHGIGKNVTFHGTLSPKEMMDVYSQCAFAVSASEYEGFGISAVEAMAAGKIPILNDIPTFREFAGNGRGWVVDFSSISTASEALLSASSLSLTRIQKLSREASAYANTFSVQEVANKQLKIYATLLGDDFT
ncbi:MAG: glycosyltransferase family 4 protein [Candidatus Diapherotrites archaeon]|uniref:Glycosyltransferase family 4 protein n=1 Tax=Candidatus Iainarchaeum sp. TaxID=3101447 RepID=A0A8T4C5H7_9ARCH|nr:glycosyltransferase family 4 protein [Candidatus Diapherotrites archaeon]